MSDIPLRPSAGPSADAANPPAAGVARAGFGVRRFGAVNWLGLRTLYMKEVRRFLKVSFQTLAAPVVSTLLFLVVFMQAFGDARPPINGTPYLQFLAPGLIMMGVLTNAFANASSSLIIGKVQGSIVDILTPPLSPAELTAAFVGGAVTRGALVGVVSALASAGVMAFSDAPMELARPLAALWFLLAGSAAFGAAGVVAGMWAEKFDQLAAVTNFLITPLTFLSGTFYAVGNLPEPFLTFSAFNPVFYLIDGFRYGFTGAAETPLALSVAVTGGVAAAFCALAYALLRAGWKLKS